MSDTPFVHLHVHTEFSLLDGLSKISRLVEHAKSMEMPALAITDHGTMFGVIDFYRACKKAGIKPILGMEGYLAPRTMRDKDARLDSKPYHLLMLAQNETGYRNLLKIASAAQLEGYYYRPRIDKEFLQQHKDGIVTTTGCLAAEIPHLVMEGQEDKARERVHDYIDIFGRDHFYLELQQHDIPELKPVNEWLIETAKRDELHLVATADVHYVLESDFEAHDTLLCIQSSALKSDTNRLKMSDNSYFLIDQRRMWDWFGHIQDGAPLTNSIKIAEMCAIDLDKKEYHLPVFPVPEGHNSTTYLRKLAEKGLRWRYGDRVDTDPKLIERLNYELGVIDKMGFNTYFLIVWDLCEYARAADIWWNVRGSGAGCVVAYCVGITNIDPIQNNLLFERFLNPGRVSMPDIDMDFPDDRRAELISYAVRKYGEDKVAAIITFGTLGAKAAVRDVGRALNLDLQIVNETAKLIPTEPKPKPVHQYVEDNPELKQRYESDPRIREMIDTAAKLQGVARHASTHAAGVIIADKPLETYVPLHKPTKGEAKHVSDEEFGDGSSSGSISLNQVTQFPMETCESLGLLKVDFLGLSTLTIMRRACDLIEKHHGVRYSMDNIPYRPKGDPELDRMLRETFEMVSLGHTVGVFQVESSGMQQMLREMRPTKFEHIIAAVSLYRPGPMDYIPDFNARMHGEKEVHYHHPRMENILSETYGIIVYQEQLMQVASELFGYSLGEADLMRRAVSKKKKEDLHKHKSIFIEQGPKVDPTITPEVAEKIFDDIEFFANYGFNKCVVGETEIIDADTGRIVTVEDLYTGKAIVSCTPSMNTGSLKLENRPIAQVMANGVKPVYRLTTQLGRQIEATDNHPFYTFDGWRNLGQLQTGDQIAVPRRIPVEGRAAWDAETFWSKTKDTLHLIASENGIPPEYFELRNQQVAEFLAWLWYADGQVFEDHVVYVGSCYPVARQLQHLLLRLGILSKISFADKFWTICVETPHDLNTFMNVIGCYFDQIEPNIWLSLPRLRSYLSGREVILASEARQLSEDIYWDKIVSIEYVGEKPTYDLTIPDTHNFIANDIIVHNSHAADYAVITVQTAFLKAHYPAEYMAALLSVYFDDPDKMAILLDECRRLELPLMAPDINYSSLDFDIQSLPDGRRGIRFGMAAVKNAGIAALVPIIHEREKHGVFDSLQDFCQRIDLRPVGKRTLESLIKVGAFDTMGTRPTLLQALDRVISFSAEHHKAKEIGQISLFGDSTGVSASNDDLLRNLPHAEEAPLREILDWEKELLGIYVSQHPIDRLWSQLRGSHNLVTTQDIKAWDDSKNNTNVQVIGLVAGLRKMPTKSKDMMCIVTLEDRFGSLDAVLFPRNWAKFQDIMEESEGKVFMFIGKADRSRGSWQIVCENIRAQFEDVGSANDPIAHDTVQAKWVDQDEPPPRQSFGNGNGYHQGSETAFTPPEPPDVPYFDSNTPISNEPPEWALDKGSSETLPDFSEFDGFDGFNGQQKPPRLLVIRMERGDHELRRWKRVHGLLTQFNGQDRVQLILMSDGEEIDWIDFPDLTTDCADALLAKLKTVNGVSFEVVEAPQGTTHSG